MIAPPPALWRVNTLWGKRSVSERFASGKERSMSKQLDMNRPLDVDESLNRDEPLITNELFSEELWVLDLLEESDEEYYYDSHPTQEDLMATTAIHARLVRYLVSVLEQLF